MAKSSSGSGVGLFLLLVIAAFVVTAIVSPRATDTSGIDPAVLAEAREATGGAMTREEIMARQEGLSVDTSLRRSNIGNPDQAAPISGQLGTLGGASDSDMFRALRYSEANLTTQARGPAADVVIQDTGMGWLTFREGPLARWGGWGLLGTIGLLLLFYFARGRITIDGKKTGETITRFAGFERFSHWLLATSFILLGITGLIVFFGRQLIPLIGHDAFATIALYSKWVHNNVAWAFMVSLVFVFVVWVWHNIPNMTDVRWMAQGGGLFVKGVHPPAKKFNAGQKLIFWSVILLGGSISLSGLSMLFPFELPMFGKTFNVLNQTGIPQVLGLGVLPTDLLPHHEMQLATAWHAIVSFALMAIIIAHIYIGSVGMEGAFDAMGSGEVEKQWAREHHSIWYEDVTGEKVAHHDADHGRARPQGTPAE
ncbi:MAG: formate dehydrogenase subunit gamma [Pseudomonadota bacterium]